MSHNPQPPVLPLAYSIAGCSEHSGRYVADNILVDHPMDQGSRWSGAYQASNIKQWMLLKLDHLAILRECSCCSRTVHKANHLWRAGTVTFGKVRLAVLISHHVFGTDDAMDSSPSVPPRSVPWLSLSGHTTRSSASCLKHTHAT